MKFFLLRAFVGLVAIVAVGFVYASFYLALENGGRLPL